ncbi:FAD-dependent monooxygenase [Acuticoccus sp. M5D2P5]|uniref:FAD-dependent monooxygenase n=1 Tax=Acuticoccus kalidii TaxID=2910977 RepID=UPI001F19A453|nr:FAD-dependent monooxygenase [Acuticoccus kalidii]MCF3933376.1 FAD-dependent monooxygenase [Acuticoccus kalidii]
MKRTIAIAGGAVVGRTLAVALASQSHLKVRLFTGPQPGADSRASALAAAGRRLYGRLGVWPMVANLAEPIREMRITDSAADDVIRPDLLHFAGDVEGNPFAHMVPNEALYEALVARCEALDIETIPASVTFYTEDERGVSIEASDGGSYGAEILVAADGRRSKIRQISGIGVVERTYEQSGIVGTVVHEEPHHGVATQHFLPNGPFAMLPLTGNRSSIVWTERPAFARELVDMDPLLAGLEIERAFGLSLGRLMVEGELQCYPLTAMLARGWFAGRVALAGDAAHVIHPLAGQGLNLGLRDVAALAEGLVESARNGEDLALALPRYESQRRGDTTQMALVMDGLNTIFSTRSSLARAVRSVGLGLVDKRTRLKGLFIREAAGVEGDIPRLLRGEAI